MAGGVSGAGRDRAFAAADDAPAAPRRAQAREHLPRAGEFLLWPPNVQAWGYRIVDRLFASRTVPRGPNVRPLATGPELDLRWTGADGQPTDLWRFMERNHVAGLMVLHRGRVLCERYGLGLAPSQRWSTMSTVKSMTAILIGIAVRDGAIESLDDPVTRYLPALAGSAYDRVRVRHLLTMTTGTRWTEAYDDPQSDVNRYSRSLADRVPGGVLALMRELPAQAAPGERFLYNTGDSYLLGALLVAATGEPMADFLSTRVWQPMGMEFDAFYTLESEGGQEIAGSRAGITLRDMARFALYVAADGVIDGRPTLPEGWVAECGRAQVRVDDPLMLRRGITGYGWCWWIGDDGAMNALGFAGQRIWIDPSRERVVTMLSAQPQPPYLTPAYADFDAETRVFLQAVCASLD